MRINRVYQNAELVIESNLELDKAASLHLAKVLRIKVGTSIELFNGDGFYYQAQVSQIERNQVTVNIIEKRQASTESPLNIHLYQGISRGDKMDLTLQKGVELGVKSFTPIITERCGVKLDEKRWQKKHEHWQKVIISACEQSGRNFIPRINPVLPWEQAIQNLSKNAYFLDPHSDKAFRDYAKPDLNTEIQLWVGPEGGFSEHEVIQITKTESYPVFLGPRVLRTETAALAAVSAINALWGDF
ncbi:MAG: 16S rRNA (uracil(1498)-N(3))-methyltransferase [Gammaproteobacteria bacterium]|nr:16S rRNA (uracil(1498)-N(3))-methyltransferase [Gammaproteobacteria bacterium]